MSTILTDAGFDSAIIPSLRVKDLRGFLSIGKAIQDASLETKGAIGAYAFEEMNETAISYKCGTEWKYGNINTLINKSLAIDYQTTATYKTNYELTGNIVDGLIASFSTRSDNSEWLSDDGAAAVKDKLSNVKPYLFSTEPTGEKYDYASTIGTWTGKLSKDLGRSNYETWKSGFNSIKNEDSLTKTLGFLLDPLLQNAFYLPVENTMTITLGYLFSYGGDFSSYSTEELYSSLAFVCGHELTHGFDSKGSHFDKNGKHLGTDTSILPAADDVIFKAKQEKVIALYDGKEYLPVARFATSGKTVLSEAMADIGGFGLVEGMSGLISDFDYELFYRYVAKHMASKANFITSALLHSDVHPFGPLRCNIVLSNNDKFESTFDIQPEDGMYIAKEDRVVIW